MAGLRGIRRDHKHVGETGYMSRSGVYSGVGVYDWL